MEAASGARGAADNGWHHFTCTSCSYTVCTEDASFDVDGLPCAKCGSAGWKAVDRDVYKTRKEMEEDGARGQFDTSNA